MAEHTRKAYGLYWEEAGDVFALNIDSGEAPRAYTKAGLFCARSLSPVQWIEMPNGFFSKMTKETWDERTEDAGMGFAVDECAAVLTYAGYGLPVGDELANLSQFDDGKHLFFLQTSPYRVPPRTTVWVLRDTRADELRAKAAELEREADEIETARAIV